jgi:TolA-binding protein
MSTLPQRIASAFAVLCGRYGDVTRMAQDREQSRQSLYREAQQVVDAVEDTAHQARIVELEQQLDGLRSQVHDLQQRLEQAVEMTPETQAELASVAQAEGVSLPTARRILQVLLPPAIRSVPTLGRATAEAGTRAGALLEVLDEVAGPLVTQATADEIFSAANRS